ncbi:hypothetical protein [Streptomyces sp. NPDC058011]|uniref:hypothetical protein n=1 Tax=Streptomyces sp. NPDC058011 TaxID=3346305 RepID=UPI0036E1186C
MTSTQGYDERAGQALLNMYRLVSGGGGHSGAAIRDAYDDLFDASDADFRAAAASNNTQGMVVARDAALKESAELLQANAQIGLGLLATVVNLTGMTPEETIRKARQLAAENTG